MATKGYEQYKRAKLPFVGSQHNRTNSSSKDSLFLNCYLEKIRDAVEGQQESNTYYLIKRPGYGTATDVNVGAAAARGVYYWWKSGKTYSVFANKLYSNTTNIQTLQNSSGAIGFEEIYTDQHYLIVSDGVYIYLINSSDTVTVVQRGTVIDVEVSAGGSGYTSAPTVFFTGGGGSGAVATATIASGAVDTVTVTTAGTGYTSVPTVSFGRSFATTDVDTANDTITLSAHGLPANHPIKFTTTSGLPAPLSSATQYYVRSPTTNTFKVSTTQSDAGLIDITTTGAGTHTVGSGGGSGATATAYINSLPNPHNPQIVVLDSYIFIHETNTDKIWNTETLQPTKIYSDAYISAETHPDKLTTISRYQNNIVGHGDSTTEFFYDAANATGSPLSRNDQISNQFGCAAALSVLRIDNTTCWVARSQMGGFCVVTLDGYTPKVISTEPIEKILNAEGSSMSSAYAWKVRIHGHIFYVLNLTSQNRTLVYDFREGEWHEWSETVSAAANKTQIYSATDADGTIKVQHLTDGKLYLLSQSTYQDNGTAISFKYVSPLFDAGTLKRKFMSRLELAGDVQSAGDVSVRYSDDDYSTWSTARTISMTGIHQYLVRLGSFRRRAFELTHTANYPLRLEAMEFELELGEF
jgi:hypothetical protein